MPNIVTTSAATLKSDIGKRSANKPLCRCLSWLYSSFSEIKKQLDEKHYFNTISIAQPLRVALLK